MRASMNDILAMINAALFAGYQSCKAWRNIRYLSPRQFLILQQCLYRGMSASKSMMFDMSDFSDVIGLLSMIPIRSFTLAELLFIFF